MTPRCTAKNAWSDRMAYDTLIRNATVIDGSGEPRYRADVALGDGRIAVIARAEELRL